jgi:hypothetical protein
VKIAINDEDNTKYPNLALMKISAHEKSKGNIVDWYNNNDLFDKVYTSRVFILIVMPNR